MIVYLFIFYANILSLNITDSLLKTYSSITPQRKFPGESNNHTKENHHMPSWIDGM